MPTIHFEGNDLGPPATAHAPEGGRILDASDDTRAPVAFSCRAATCGTCRVDVIAGAHLLAPPAADERDLLDRLGASPAQRLACQAVALPGPGLIRLRWVRAP